MSCEAAYRSIPYLSSSHKATIKCRATKKGRLLHMHSLHPSRSARYELPSQLPSLPFVPLRQKIPHLLAASTVACIPQVWGRRSTRSVVVNRRDQGYMIILIGVAALRHGVDV